MQVITNYKHHFAVLALLCLLQTSTAQVQIAGKVADSANKPLMNVNVLLLMPSDSSLVKASVTNSTGIFLINNIKEGNYILSISLVGYETVLKPLTLNSQPATQSLPQTIILNKQVQQLTEITITSQKPLLELKIDRTVVNVKSSVTLAGSTALDVLERSPGVLINRQTNTISMMGKSGIIIMINGKVSNMPPESILQMLSGMNASSIERIELITTPPANFDAEGNAGIINFVLTKNKMYGTNGTVAASVGYLRNGPITNASIDFNNRTPKGNFFGNFGFSRNEWLQNFNNYRKLVSGSQVKIVDANTYREPVQLNYNGRICYDYNLTNKTVLGAVISGYSSKWSMAANNDVLYTTNNVIDTTVRMYLYEINHWKNLSGNLNFLHNFTADAKIAVDLDYQYYIDNQPVDYLSTYYNGAGNLLSNINTISRKTTPIHIYVLKADYGGKLNKKLTMDAGFKAAFNRFENNILVQDKINNNWKTDSSLSVHARLNEDVKAIYASFTLAVNEKTGIKAGLRYENTTTELTRIDGVKLVDRKLRNLFPSVFLSRKINDNYSFNISFSRRITRPTFNEMAPFVILVDPSTFITGNPGLRPSTSYTLSNTWALKQKSIQLSYSIEDNSIARFQTRIDEITGKQIMFSENIKSIKSFAMVLSVPLNPIRWWSMQYNFTGQWQQVNAFFENQPLRVEQLNYFISTTQTFKLPKSFSFELRYNYNSKALYGKLVTMPISFMDAGIQKKFNNKASLSVNVSDIFNSNRIAWINDFSPDIYTSLKGQFFPRNVRLNFSVPFGSNEIKAARKRTTAAEEEKRVD